MASGSPAQATSTSAVASGSAAARSSPTIRENSASASVSSSTFRSTNRVLARSGVRLRVVTRTAHDELPGSSGLTWAASLALSSRISTRRPVSVVRYSAARSSSRAGTLSPGDAEVAQEPGQHLARAGRLGARPEQVHVELAVGELRADLVGGVHGERGLAEAAPRRSRTAIGTAPGLLRRVGAEQQRAQVLDRASRGR